MFMVVIWVNCGLHEEQDNPKVLQESILGTQCLNPGNNLTYDLT